AAWAGADPRQRHGHLSRQRRSPESVIPGMPTQSMECLCRPAIVDRRRAFTLVELLVVVGVIALLIAMLLPVLSRARRAANNAACLSNLRQVHQSFHLYALDHRDAVPLGYRSATKQFNSMIY